MKLVFREWKDQAAALTHPVGAVKANRAGQLVAQGARQPLSWSGARTALGRVSNLDLKGSFLVEFSFEKADLAGWLEAYVRAEPADALHLLSKMQAEAVVAVALTPLGESDGTS